MNEGFSPMVIVQALARNIVPLVGILAFHWSAGNVLVLYLLDTLLSMTVIIAGLMSKFAPPPDDDGIAGNINAQAGYVFAALFFSAFAAVPLGMPVGIMLAASGFSFREALVDHSLRVGALVQAAVALWSYRCRGLDGAVEHVRRAGPERRPRLLVPAHGQPAAA